MSAREVLERWNGPGLPEDVRAAIREVLDEREKWFLAIEPMNVHTDLGQYLRGCSVEEVAEYLREKETLHREEVKTLREALLVVREKHYLWLHPGGTPSCTACEVTDLVDAAIAAQPTERAKPEPDGICPARGPYAQAHVILQGEKHCTACGAAAHGTGEGE
jgi:hypothetical protein